MTMLLTTRRRSVLIGCLSLPLAGLFAQSTQARPQYAQKEGVGCLHCHVQPGRARNFRGLYYAAHQLSFAEFDETYEAQQAGVKPGSQGPEARPTVAKYPNERV